MKKRLMAATMAVVMAASLVGCSGSSNSAASGSASGTGSSAGTQSSAASSSSASGNASASSSASSSGSAEASTGDGTIAYKDIKLGETGTDLNVELKMLSHRTDMLASDYAGTNWDTYLEEFNKTYPGIKIDIEGITNYADDALTRLQGGDWGDIMMIPAVSKAELPTYFLSYGTKDDVASEVNYINNWEYKGQVYGIPTTANAQGIVYNKAVFEKAGITELPTNPDDFIADLKKIKDNTDAIPLYTNYAAGWTLGAWDAYLTGANGSSAWVNDGLIHGTNPFSDPGDGSGAYNVYKILYEAVKDGLTEDDYTTTDWEGSKGMINRGEIATMVLGSWAVPQMQGAGDNADDIGYMPFPVSVGGKMYASAGPDYNFGINANIDADKQEAAMIFVKWFTEQSGFSYNEGGLPIATSDNKVPELYSQFDALNVTYLTDDPAPEGEEDLMNELNSDSELAINAGGNDKVAKIIECASDGSESFDDIMNDWNTKWSDAQSTEGVTTN